MYFIGHILIALIIFIPLCIILRYGLKDYNSKDPAKRTFAKSIVIGSIFSILVMVLYLFDAYFNSTN
jgi:hypothetical protein